MACSKCWWFDGQEQCSGDCRKRKTSKQIWQKWLNIAFITAALFAIGILASCHKITSQNEIYQKWPNLRENYTIIDTTGQYLIPRGPVDRSAYLYE